MTASVNARATKYFDLQVNGYCGVDFNDPSIDVDDVVRAAEAMRADGVVAAFPTVITAAPNVMLKCISILAQAIQSQPTVASTFRGLHVEGPFLSSESGYVGAHPVQFAALADPGVMQEIIDAGAGLVRLLTLAPEIDGASDVIRHCRSQGVAVAAGHTNCTRDQLKESIDSGLEYFTHLGNACPVNMHRHDNILIRALSLASELRITVIADGHHLPALLFQQMLQWIPEENLAVVSDAISAAGLGAGTYQLGGRSVEVRPDLAAWDSQGEHFVGAASRMLDADAWLQRRLGLSDRERHRLLFDNASRWFGK